MPNNLRQWRVTLQWEATCERLRNALQPTQEASEFPQADLVEAYEFALQALEAIRQAFDIDPLQKQSLGLSMANTTERANRHDA
jgi:hypothetical protein